MLRFLSPREKKILFLTIGVIILALIFNIFLAPLLTEIAGLNKEIRFTRAKLQKYLWLLSQKDNIQKKYGVIASGVKLAEGQEDTMVNALSEIEGLAKKSGVKIIDIRPQSTKTMDLYREIFIDVRAEGAMSNYINFIYNLEKSLTLLKIRKVQLSAKPNTEGLEANFSISQITE